MAGQTKVSGHSASAHCLTIRQVSQLLEAAGLLKEIISGDQADWTHSADYLRPELADEQLTDLSYDSRQVTASSLFFCKGNFRAAYFAPANQAGLRWYVAEIDYSGATPAHGLIVTDVHRALALLAAAFYDRPQDELTVIGITGTKGKTTTAYFTQAILNAYSGGRAALLSSVDNCVDGQHFVESDLTTPESLDLFRFMRQAVDLGMRYLVMEVSSQAYKTERVFGLTFDVGAFLNISPDHISPIEHPSFEDYLWCKRQIIRNSRHLVLGADCAQAGLLRADAKAYAVPVSEFGDGLSLREQHPLSIEGDFNYANAAAALSIVSALGLPADDPALAAMDRVTIAGRMEKFTSSEGIIAYVDYAHNGTSVSKLLDFVERRYGHNDDGSPRQLHITLVTGSTGDKALDRRQEIVQAAQDRIDQFIFTEEDTDSEPVKDVVAQMMAAVTNPTVKTRVILDRTEAIESAVAAARSHGGSGDSRITIILVIGKGEERWIKRHNHHIPYEGDDRVVRRLLQP